jgi:hypothetical protein
MNRAINNIAFKIRNRRSIVLTIPLILFVFLNLLCLEIREPNYFLYDDNADYFLPAYSYNWHAVIEHKTIPLINLHQYLGHAYLAQGETGVLYLPIYISTFLSKITTGNIFYTIDILVLIHLTASSIGMLLLLKRFDLSPAASFLGSLMWITMPFISIASRSWVVVSYVAAYLPFNFLLLNKLIDDPKTKNALYLALLKSAFFYQGYVQYVFMTILFEVIYVLLLSASKLFISNSYKEYLKTFPRSYISSAFFFFCLIAPLLFPMFLLQQESDYRSTKVAFHDFIFNSMSWDDFINATQFLKFRKDVIWSAGSEIFYFGFVNLLLLSPVLVRKFRENYKILTCVLAAAIALVFSTRLYAVFYNISILNLFRWPFKCFLFFLFFGTIGVAGIVNTLVCQDRRWIKILVLLILILAVGLNCFVLWKKSESRNVFNTVHIDNPPKNYLEKYIRKKAGRIFTLWVNDVDPEELYKYFTFSFATLFGYYHFGGYDPLISKQNLKLSLGVQHINVFNGPVSEALLSYLSSWSVKYLITKDSFYNRSQLNRFDQLKLKYRDNNILMYENVSSLPLAYYKDNVQEALKFEFGINEINIYPNNSSAKVIVINVAPLPQFKIYINGIDLGKINPGEVPITISIPPNTKQLKLKYVDYPFYAGTLVFVLCGAGLVGFLVISLLKKPETPVVKE